MILRILLVLLLLPFWVYLRSVYRDRLGAFGCFDDCFNYLAGHFLLQGKQLFSQIFFNHQPLPAYLSMLIQWWTKPDSLYLLVYQHRMFLIYFSLAANIILTLRFGLVGFSFSLLFESSKGFVFGDRFLAESLIVYPLVYLFGIVWEKLSISKIISWWELLISAVLAWFVVFSREPYIPLALFLFGVMVWKNKHAGYALILLVILSIFTIVYHNLPEYFFNLVTVNRLTVAEGEIAANQLFGWGIWKIFAYPVLVFFPRQINLFSLTEIVLAGLFWLNLLTGIRKKKFWLTPIFLLVILGLANIRITQPGQIYYAAFHHLVWYGLFIFAVLLLVKHNPKIISWFSIAIFAGLTIYQWISPNSYLREKIDRQTEFTTNYGHYFAMGEIIKKLSSPGDSLFLDGWDDPIYFQARRASDYPYSWYTSLMPQLAKYALARKEMFKNFPPKLYYGRCEDNSGSVLPMELADQYSRVVWQSRPTCLFIHQSQRQKLTETVLEQVRAEGYTFSP